MSSKIDPRKPSPLVIALHGRGAEPEMIVPSIGYEAEDRGYIVAAPMGYNLEGWYGANGPGGELITPSNLGELSEKDVMQVLDIMLNTYNIDRRRIYLLGSSMGGAGALHLGIKHDTLWAAIAAAAPAFRRTQSPTQYEYYEIEDGGHSAAMIASAERFFKFFDRNRKPAATRAPSS